jgi:23S rRNA U2552 (ribose-2'-O)-methylase RlmE/FtsJ
MFKEICLKNNTDKGIHIINKKKETYADIYEKYFIEKKNDNLVILELGVKNGASLKAYREYFPNAIIYGLDIDPSCIQYNDPNNNIFVEIISQIDEDKINNFIKDKKFDIIIDDASHVNKFTIISFNLLFESLNSSGLYIIEDLGCSYLKLQDEFNVEEIWPGMSFNTNKDFNNDIKDIHNFTNNIIEKMDLGINKYETYSLSDISFIHRYKFIIIIGKN